MSPLRQRMIEDLKIRNYSERTIRRYVEVIAQLSRYFDNRSPDRLTPEDVRKYLVFQVSRKVSVSLLKQIVCAVRFLFRWTLGRDFPTYLIPYPREERKIPVILTQGEVAALIAAADNLKHRAILATIYGIGVRLTELTLLKVADIDSQRMVITVRQGKGHKDREVPLSPRLLELLRTYFRKHRPHVWLFPGPSQRADLPISTSTVQHACATALKRAGINKHATPHSLRHAYTTHLLEKGVSVRVVQEFLGHTSLKTTQRYSHVTPDAVKSARETIDSLPAFADLSL